MAGKVQFSLRGIPPVAGGRTRWEWRRRLGAEAAKVRPDGPPSPATSFAVRMVFYLTEHRFAGMDLDRLVTPVLDTLFSSRDTQADRDLTGALFPSADDSAVIHLEVRKAPVGNLGDEGVDVIVRWYDPAGGTGETNTEVGGEPDQ